jgi:hypothetical protein
VIEVANWIRRQTVQLQSGGSSGTPYPGCLHAPTHPSTWSPSSLKDHGVTRTIKTFVHCCMHRVGFTVMGGPRGNQNVETPVSNKVITILFVSGLISYNN